MPKQTPYKPKFGYDMRVKPPQDDKVQQRGEQICEWEGCNQKGPHKAPRSRNNVHDYQWFCLAHAREFNRSWNFFDGWSDDEVRSYQKDASTGHRPTWKMGDGAPGAERPTVDEAEDPLGLFERTRGRQQTRSPERKLPKKVENAFTVLGLEPPSSTKVIKARYKDLVKKFHPDANHGEKGFEERLKRIIEAYQNLKSAGFC